MVLASFSIKDKKRNSCFFEKTFILTDISMDITLKISFFTLKNVDINFIGRHIYCKTYTIAEVFLTTRQVKLIEKNEFTVIALNLENKAFVIYVAFINQDLDVHHTQRAQIASLKADETPTSISSKFVDFADVFFKNLAAKLSEHI